MNAETARLRTAIKPRDAWWAHWVIGPLANRVVGAIAPVTWVTPNRVTVASLAVGLVATAAFARGTPAALAAGGVILQLSFLLDCVDGQLSRYRGTSSLYGAILDQMCDRWKLFAVVLGLAVGLWRVEGTMTGFALGLVYFFAEYMLEVYVRNYRRLAEGAVSGTAEPGSAVRLVRDVLRTLDLPLVRLAFADRYFLVSAFTIVGAAGPLLWLLAGLGTLQVLLRPIYYACHFRTENGTWPWNDERRHTLEDRQRS